MELSHPEPFLFSYPESSMFPAMSIQEPPTMHFRDHPSSFTAHKLSCNLHEDDESELCWGIQRGGARCRKRTTGGQRGWLPTCKTHSKQKERSGVCKAFLGCGIECGHRLRWKPHQISLCPEHEELPMPCYLLKLPTELRFRIFSFLLPNKTIPARFVSSGDLRSGGEACDPQVLRLNHQMHEEAASVLYGQNAFEIEVSGGTSIFICNSKHTIESFVMEPSRQGRDPTYGGCVRVSAPSNAALHDYQMQLMLLEQQNKKRLLMARQEQDNISSNSNTTQQPGGGAANSFTPKMSASGNQAGPSSNLNDQMRNIAGAPSTSASSPATSSKLPPSQLNVPGQPEPSEHMLDIDASSSPPIWEPSRPRPFYFDLIRSFRVKILYPAASMVPIQPYLGMPPPVSHHYAHIQTPEQQQRQARQVQMRQVTLQQLQFNANHNPVPPYAPIPCYSSNDLATFERIQYETCDALHQLVGKFKMKSGPVNRLDVSMELDQYEDTEECLAAAQLFLQPFRSLRNIGTPTVSAVAWIDKSCTFHDVLSKNLTRVGDNSFAGYLRGWKDDLSRSAPDPETSLVIYAYWVLHRVIRDLMKHPDIGRIARSQKALQDLGQQAKVAREAEDMTDLRFISKRVRGIWDDYMDEQRGFEERFARRVGFADGLLGTYSPDPPQTLEYEGKGKGKVREQLLTPALIRQAKEAKMALTQGEGQQQLPVMRTNPTQSTPPHIAQQQVSSHQQSMKQLQQQAQQHMVHPQPYAMASPAGQNMAAYAQQQRMFMQRAQMQQQRLMQQQALRQQQAQMQQQVLMQQQPQGFPTGQIQMGHQTIPLQSIATQGNIPSINMQQYPAAPFPPQTGHNWPAPGWYQGPQNLPPLPPPPPHQFPPPPHQVPPPPHQVPPPPHQVPPPPHQVPPPPHQVPPPPHQVPPPPHQVPPPPHQVPPPPHQVPPPPHQVPPPPHQVPPPPHQVPPPPQQVPPPPQQVPPPPAYHLPPPPPPNSHQLLPPSPPLTSPQTPVAERRRNVVFTGSTPEQNQQLASPPTNGERMRTNLALSLTDDELRRRIMKQKLKLLIKQNGGTALQQQQQQFIKQEVDDGG